MIWKTRLIIALMTVSILLIGTNGYAEAENGVYSVSYESHFNKNTDWMWLVNYHSNMQEFFPSIKPYILSDIIDINMPISVKNSTIYNGKHTFNIVDVYNGTYASNISYQDYNGYTFGIPTAKIPIGHYKYINAKYVTTIILNNFNYDSSFQRISFPENEQETVFYVYSFHKYGDINPRNKIVLVDERTLYNGGNSLHELIYLIKYNYNGEMAIFPLWDTNGKSTLIATTLIQFTIDVEQKNTTKGYIDNTNANIMVKAGVNYNPNYFNIQFKNVFNASLKDMVMTVYSLYYCIPSSINGYNGTKKMELANLNSGFLNQDSSLNVQYMPMNTTIQNRTQNSNNSNIWAIIVSSIIGVVGTVMISESVIWLRRLKK